MPKLQKTVKYKKGVAMFGLRKTRRKNSGVHIYKAVNEGWPKSGQFIYY
jgi:hypothetical protein